MTTIYVNTQGSKVQINGNLVLVGKYGAKPEAIPVEKIDQLVLMGRGVQISTAALIALWQRDIPVLITNQHGDKLYINIAGISRYAELREQQSQVCRHPDSALQLARDMIMGKLTNQRALLAQTGWAEAPTAIRQIEQQQRSLAAATTIDMVRGYEGAAAAAYFGAWRLALPKVWGFRGRAFQPPPDPVNALLSFGYTLALNNVLTAIHIAGLDPYLGTFHVTEPGRPSLALDVLEEFRPLVVDRLVLGMLDAGDITPAMFERLPQQPNAVYMNAAGRKFFVQRYEAHMASAATLPNATQTALRRVFLIQVQALVHVMRGEQERYVAYTPQ